MSGVAQNILKIAGGDQSDWVSGTDLYTVPDGYIVYAINPGADGCTIDDGSLWQKSKHTSNEAITDAVASQWYGRSVTSGPIVPKYPITKVKLSAGDCQVFMKKTDWR